MADQQPVNVTVNTEGGFTNKEILVRLENKVDKVLDDHEQRIRAGETADSRIKGALAVVTFIVIPLVSVGSGLIHL